MHNNRSFVIFVLVFFLTTFFSCSKHSEQIIIEQCKIDTVCTIYEDNDSCSVRCNYTIDYLKTQRQFDWVNKFIALQYSAICQDEQIPEVVSPDMIDSLYSILFNPDITMHSILINQSQVFINRYFKDKNEIGMINYELSGKIKLDRTFDDILLCSNLTYIYLSGAHGVTSVKYYNVDLQQRKILGYNDIFSENAKEVLHPLLIEGLCHYFDVGKDQLGEQLFESDLQKLNLPESIPALTKDGVLFQYQAYEIAAYAAGCPSFVVPYDKLQDILIIKDRLKLDGR